MRLYKKRSNFNNYFLLSYSLSVVSSAKVYVQFKSCVTFLIVNMFVAVFSSLSTVTPSHVSLAPVYLYPSFLLNGKAAEPLLSTDKGDLTLTNAPPTTFRLT